MDEIEGMPPEVDGGLKVSLTAALSRQYASDQREFLPMLARMLESSLPETTEVAMRGGLFSKKTVQRVTVSFGETRYALEDPGRGPLRATRTRVVRGIALKTEEISAPEWVSEVGAALDVQARSNEAARDALSRFVW